MVDAVATMRPAVHHAADRLLEGEERALEVDVDNPVELLFGHLRDGRFDILDSRIGDDAVDRPEILLGRIEQGLHVFATPDIALHENAFAPLVANGGARFLRSCLVRRVAEREIVSERR